MALDVWAMSTPLTRHGGLKDGRLQRWICLYVITAVWWTSKWTWIWCRHSYIDFHCNPAELAVMKPRFKRSWIEHDYATIVCVYSSNSQLLGVSPFKYTLILLLVSSGQPAAWGNETDSQYRCVQMSRSDKPLWNKANLAGHDLGGVFKST